MTSSSPLDVLRNRVRSLAPRAHVPFSKTPTAAGLLIRNGTWIPGVRIESASYSLTLPALVNAYTTAVALGRDEEVVAFVLSRPLRREEQLYLQDLPHGPYQAYANDAWLPPRAHRDGSLPLPDAPVPPVLGAGPQNGGAEDHPQRGLTRAREAAQRAYVPSSGYKVGAAMELEDGRIVPGANVEHPDWTRILCAERNALGTVLSYGLPDIRRLFLACLSDPHGTPCGACRQLLAEQASNATVWMDRHEASPEDTTVSDLLPGSFQGRALLEDS